MVRTSKRLIFVIFLYTWLQMKEIVHLLGQLLLPSAQNVRIRDFIIRIPSTVCLGGRFEGIFVVMEEFLECAQLKASLSLTRSIRFSGSTEKILCRSELNNRLYSVVLVAHICSQFAAKLNDEDSCLVKFDQKVGAERRYLYFT